jgi:cystathionine beta-lyase
VDDRTRLIRSATRRPHARRTVNPPVERGTTLLNARAADLRDEKLGPVYGIDGAAVHRELRTLLAEMEGAHETQIVPTGLSAVTLAVLALVQPGDEILVSDACYWPSRRFFLRTLARFGLTLRLHSPRAAPHEIEALITHSTRLILMESPGTATFEVQDIPGIVAVARAKGVHTVVDNTWAAGLLFKPLAYGADISVQALSKYVAGHSDVFGGAISSASPGIALRVQTLIEDLGVYVSPDDAWLMLRGLRTLPVRLAQHEVNARQIAEWLSSRSEIADVLWPGLPASPDHDLWKRDFTGASGLMGVVLDGGDLAAVEALLDALDLFGMGFSWGGYESLATYEDAQLSVRASPPRLAGPLIRLHVGLESPEDLIADLEKGLLAFKAAR